MKREPGFWQLFLLVVLLSFLVQAIHEGGHWVIYEMRGRGPVWGFSSLVQLWGQTPLHPEQWVQFTSPDGETGWLHLTSLPNSQAEQIAMLAGGPLASLFAVYAGLAIMRFGRNHITRQMGLSLSLVGSFIAGLYYLGAPFRSGGDEFYLAANLGISRSLVEIAFGMAIGAAFAVGLRALGGWRSRGRWIVALLLGSPLTGLAVMQGNRIVQEQVNQGNPLFQSVLGFSLPVVVVNGLVLVGLMLWWYQAKAQSDGDLALLRAPAKA